MIVLKFLKGMYENSSEERKEKKKKKRPDARCTHLLQHIEGAKTIKMLLWRANQVIKWARICQQFFKEHLAFIKIEKCPQSPLW